MLCLTSDPKKSKGPLFLQITVNPRGGCNVGEDSESIRRLWNTQTDKHAGTRSHVTEIHFLLFRWICTFSIVQDVLTGWLSDTSCLLAAAPFFCFIFFLFLTICYSLFSLARSSSQNCLRKTSSFCTSFSSVIPIGLAERESKQFDLSGHVAASPLHAFHKK